MCDRVEALLRMYDEHAKQARQHEDQRERMTNLILLVAGALLAFVSYNGLKADMLIVSIPMIILGAYGCLFSLKHYEKNRLHTDILGKFRKEIDQELNSPHQSIGDIRDSGDKKHKGNPLGRDKHKVDHFKRRDNWLLNLRLYQLWAGLPLLVAGYGLLLSALIIVNLYGSTPR